MPKDYYDGPPSWWYDPPEPECSCDKCKWCHDNYDHNWYDWNVSLEEWDCQYCVDHFNEALDESLKFGSCQSHSQRADKPCAICELLKKKDAMIENDIDFSVEEKHEK